MIHTNNPEIHIPPTATPIDGKNDAGKKVLVTSVGGTLCKVPGTVMVGPYIFTYSLQSSVDVSGKKYKKDKKDSREKLLLTKFTTQPYWCVRLDKWGYEKYLSFVSEELKFL